jgi:hypothetical protein
MGDAIKEYIHTYEKLNVPAETLLKLYDDLLRRYPKVKIFNELDSYGWITNYAWLKVRSGKLLGQLGRHKEAVVEATRGEKTLSQTRFFLPAFRVSMSNTFDHNMLTGEVYTGEKTGPFGVLRAFTDFTFEEGEYDKTLKFGQPWQVRRNTTSDGKIQYLWFNNYQHLIAPDGYIFKSLRFFPIVEGDDATIHFSLHKDSFLDGAPTDSGEFSKAREEGFLVDRIMRTGFIQMLCHLNSKSRDRDPKIKLYGFRVVAEFEKVEVHGTIDVACSNTPNFRVDVGPWLGRKYSGLIGLIPPGEYTLRFYPTEKGAPFDEWTTTAKVEEGKITKVIGHLPWKKDSVWSSWSNGTLIGRDYPGYQINLQSTWNIPNIQVDDEAVRVVWSHAADLWCSESRDGDNFTPPQKIPMPISSGWIEQMPALVKDESGRFILAFLSDRGIQRENRPYVCWSRDFIHWSSPAMVMDRNIWHFDIIQDDKGRFIWVDGAGKKVTVLSSRDAYHWEKLAELEIEDSVQDVQVLQCEDGRYEIFVSHIHYTTPQRSRNFSNAPVLRFVSSDAVNWSEPEKITISRRS